MTADSASAISLKGVGRGKAFSNICDSDHGGLVFCALYTLAVCVDEPEPPRTRPGLASRQGTRYSSDFNCSLRYTYRVWDAQGGIVKDEGSRN